MTDATLSRPALGNIARAAATKLLLPAGLAVMLAVFAAIEPRIAGGANLLNILIQASYLAIFALAQTVVLITRGFDLSLGTCVSAVSVAAALSLGGDGGGALDTVAGVGAGLGLAAAVGVVNGWLVSYLRVSPFIATLGMLNVCLGIASMLSGGRPVFGAPDSFAALFYDGAPLGIPVPLLWAGGALLGVHLLLHHTVFGRSLALIGSNPRAAEVAGLPVRRFVTLAYVLCALLAGLGALMLTARTGSGEPNLGGNLTLESIAAAVIGGASLRGGTGGVAAALIGALFVTVLSNGMNLTRVDGNVQTIVLGGVIVAAVLLDRYRARRA